MRHVPTFIELNWNFLIYPADKQTHKEIVGKVNSLQQSCQVKHQADRCGSCLDKTIVLYWMWLTTVPKTLKQCILYICFIVLSTAAQKNIMSQIHCWIYDTLCFIRSYRLVDPSVRYILCFCAIFKWINFSKAANWCHNCRH